MVTVGFGKNSLRWWLGKGANHGLNAGVGLVLK